MVGSINRDVSIQVDRLPGPAETIAGASMVHAVGGKGANQATAAAKLGAKVAMVGAVGHDGEEALTELRSAGVDIRSIRTINDEPTGVAMILVDSEGENCIVVTPGANARLAPSDLPASLTGTVLLQHEVSPDVIEAAVVRSEHATVILNPAPFREIPAHVLQRIDLLVLNATEAGQLAGGEVPSTPSGAITTIGTMPADVTDVVVTLGADGAALRTDGQIHHIPAPKVTVVDSTGAGDVFCAALAAELTEGASALEAARFAVYAGALAVTGRGARGGQPTAEQVTNLLGSTDRLRE